MYFNPRSHERSDVYRLKSGVHTYLFQSTLPRKERHVQRLDSIKYYKISIHAPTKGATSVFELSYVRVTFQSTLPRKERRYLPTLEACESRFQSTLPRKERPCAYAVTQQPHYFNPRSHERSDKVNNSPSRH